MKLKSLIVQCITLHTQAYNHTIPKLASDLLYVINIHEYDIVNMQPQV